MAPLHGRAALLLLMGAPCHALHVPPPLSARTLSASTSTPIHHHRHEVGDECGGPCYHDAIASDHDAYDPPCGRHRISMLAQAVASLVGALAVGMGAQAQAAAPLPEAVPATLAAVASPRGASNYVPWFGDGTAAAPFGVGIAYAADVELDVGDKDQLQVQHDGPTGESSNTDRSAAPSRDLYVQYEGPDKSTASVARDKSPGLYVQIDAPGRATNARDKNPDLYGVQYDGPTKTMASSRTPPSPELAVIIEDGRRQRIRRRAPPPELSVAVEKGPSPRKVASPPPKELQVRLEQSASKKAETPAGEGKDTEEGAEIPPLNTETEEPLPADAVSPLEQKTTTATASPRETTIETKTETAAKKKQEKEDVRPETLTYIKEYNVPKSIVEKSPARTAVAAKGVREKEGTRSVKAARNERTIVAAPPTAPLSELVNNAKVFSLGVGAGIVALITRQRRKEQSAEREGSSDDALDYSTLASADSVPSDPMSEEGSVAGPGECEKMSRRPYLDSLSVVSSTGRGRQSYLDGLSGSDDNT